MLFTVHTTIGKLCAGVGVMACLGCKKQTTSKIISAAPNQIPSLQKIREQNCNFLCISTGKQTGQNKCWPPPPPPQFSCCWCILHLHCWPLALTCILKSEYTADTCNNLFYIFIAFLIHAATVSSTEVDSDSDSDSNRQGHRSNVKPKKWRQVSK
jgi:hypothetical protein